MSDLGYKAAYNNLKHALMALYPEGEASAMARIVLEELTGVSALAGFFSEAQALDRLQYMEFIRIKAALLKQEPLQYVLGYADFLGFRLRVNRAVLIPRPETEELADWVLQEQGQDLAPRSAILDIGTGSGCLAIALKAGIPAANVFALDSSSEALSLARTNAGKYGLDISFLHIDILEPQAGHILPALDLVISNPPYILPEEGAAMGSNVLDYEPQSALFVTDNDPLQFYKAIARFCKRRMKPDGCIYLELNASQAGSIAGYYRSLGWETAIKADFQGLPRMLKVFSAPDA